MTVDTKYGSFPDKMAKYVRATKMADHDHAYIRKQANELVKDAKTMRQAVQAIHEFVADFPIGYDDERSKASVIMQKRRGQCNTKTTLFTALARYAGIPTRVHAWKVHKQVHKKRMPWLVYAFTPKTTLFTYPEVYYKGKWKLISEVISRKNNMNEDACPFDDAANRKKPLKKEWIAEDLGSFWHPDTVYEEHGTNTDGWRKAAFPIAKMMLNK